MTIEEVARLARHLQQAAYSHGYEDAHPSNATTRQAKKDAQSREALNKLRAAILALLDAEAEACAGICAGLWEDSKNSDADDCAQAIRARIVARKGGNANG